MVKATGIFFCCRKLSSTFHLHVKLEPINICAEHIQDGYEVSRHWERVYRLLNAYLLSTHPVVHTQGKSKLLRVFLLNHKKKRLLDTSVFCGHANCFLVGLKLDWFKAVMYTCATQRHISWHKNLALDVPNCLDIWLWASKYFVLLHYVGVNEERY